MWRLPYYCIYWLQYKYHFYRFKKAKVKALYYSNQFDVSNEKPKSLDALFQGLPYLQKMAYHRIEADKVVNKTKLLLQPRLKA